MTIVRAAGAFLLCLVGATSSAPVSGWSTVDLPAYDRPPGSFQLLARRAQEREVIKPISWPISIRWAIDVDPNKRPTDLADTPGGLTVSAIRGPAGARRREEWLGPYPDPYRSCFLCLMRLFLNHRERG